MKEKSQLEIYYIRLILMLIISFSFTAKGISQNMIITGKVIDSADNSPLIGVSIIQKGTTNGTVTNINGLYQLSVPKGSTLIFTSVGMEKVEKVVTVSKIDVSMKMNSQQLDEVVAIGYGTMKKSDVSGSSVSLSEAQLKASFASNLNQTLQGKAAGVTAVQTSGQPGSAVAVRVRGQSTINADAEPLYVIDGVPFQVQGTSGADFGLADAMGNGKTSAISPLSTINPSDIISMEILKDASATAIYGSRASNGVILVTTKRGVSGSAKFSYEGSFTVQRQAKRMKVLNLRDFASYSNSLATQTSSFIPTEEFADPSLLGNGTNWQDAVFQLAPAQSHVFSASGGNDAVKYYVSSSYFEQDGTVIGTKFDRFSFRTNLDAQLKKWLKLGLNLAYNSTDERLGLVDSDEGIINIALQSTPDVPIYDMDGNYTAVQREGVSALVNPIAKALEEDNLLKRSALSGNIFFDVNFSKILVLRSEIAFNAGGTNAQRFYPTATYGNWVRSINQASLQKNENAYWQIKNYLTYTKNFGKHYTTLMLGQEASEWNWSYLGATTTNLPGNAIHNPSLGEFPSITSGFGSGAMASVFLRGTYSTLDKYYLTYTFRYDGSSNFGPNNRFAPFHAVAGSWRISNEAFMKDVKAINNLKLRLGWGQTGNQSIGSYQWGSSLSKMPTGLGMGYRQLNIANPNIKWETQEQTNVGLDISLFDSRIGIVIDMYNKVSKDMLMQLQLPSYMGTRGNQSSALAAPYGNYGEINNKGIELTINSHNIKGTFSWDTDMQLSTNKNKLVALDGTENVAIEGYGQWSDVVSRTTIGQSLYNFYGYKVAGVFTSKQDILDSPKQSAFPSDGVSFSPLKTVFVGDLKYEDVHKDGVIDEKDRTNIGSPLPLFTFGINNTFKYNNFDLSIFFNGTYGNKVLNYTSRNLSSMKSMWANQLSVVNERAMIEPINAAKAYPISNPDGGIISKWYDDISNVRLINPNTTIPRATPTDPNDNIRLSDRYIEDGSYIRLKNIAFGYTFPKSAIKKMYLENLRLYANIQNLLTITKYTGFDPEIGVSTASVNVYGLDNGRYPSPQSYSLGISISF